MVRSISTDVFKQVGKEGKLLGDGIVGGQCGKGEGDGMEEEGDDKLAVDRTFC